MSVPEERSATTGLAALASHVPPGQLGRYLLVGVGNTIFAYASFAFFTAILDKYIPQSYLVGSLLSAFTNITFSFVGYKKFVFKTKGNIIREWLRCVAVYSGNIAFGLLLLPLIVYSLRHHFGYQRQAPYIAGAIITALSVVLSFFGHKHITFRR